MVKQFDANLNDVQVTLLGWPRKDRVHRYRARCTTCDARCWLGPRQRALRDAITVVCCVSCAPDEFDTMHLGNPELSTSGDIAPFQRYRVRRGGDDAS
jgi:hypothetical protein